MNLDEFAKSSGFILIELSSESDIEDWGGKYGYSTWDRNKAPEFGFDTKRKAMEDWMLNTFGLGTSKALIKLLCEDEGDN